MELYDVVTKLVGPIRPVGKTETDEIRFENLKTMCDLVNALLTDIDSVAMCAHRSEFSVSRAGKYAADFQTNMRITE